MFTTRDTKDQTQICLTFIFKVNHQGQVHDFRFSEILDTVNVRIDTKIKSAACMQLKLGKVIQWMCVTLISKVNRQGHAIFSNIVDILDLENVRIDTKIEFVSCLQPEIRRVMQQGLHCGLVGSAPAWDGTGCEFDSWQCRICSLSLRVFGSLRGSLGTYGLTQKLCLKKGVWPWFSRSCKTNRIFHYHRWIPSPRKHTW